MARDQGARQLPGALLLSLFFALFGATGRAEEPPGPQPTPTPAPVPEIRKSERLTVSAVRAEDVVPVTKTEIPLATIEKENIGQEMPALLALTPSVT